MVVLSKLSGDGVAVVESNRCIRVDQVAESNTRTRQNLTGDAVQVKLFRAPVKLLPHVSKGKEGKRGFSSVAAALNRLRTILKVNDVPGVTIQSSHVVTADGVETTETKLLSGKQFVRTNLTSTTNDKVAAVVDFVQPFDLTASITVC